jgi:branched-chain amino acid transport system ATP-binding protein
VTSLALQSVSKVFGGVHAVEDLTMTIERGRITGLIGPNGAGKSTVVNVITGMMPVTAGTIRIDDRDTTAARPSQIARLGVARTFQNIRLLGEASVLENLLIGFHRHKTAGIMANCLGLASVGREYRALVDRARALLRRFDMERYVDLPAGDLSYGHQRRVEMMRALATEPRYLLLDEPIAGMNGVEAGALGKIYREIAAGGIGILLIEHNVGFVAEHCEAINVLDLGRLIASGPPDQVLDDPRVIEAYLGN